VRYRARARREIEKSAQGGGGGGGGRVIHHSYRPSECTLKRTRLIEIIGDVEADLSVLAAFKENRVEEAETVDERAIRGMRAVMRGSGTMGEEGR
jgi:hypothetical protein